MIVSIHEVIITLVRTFTILLQPVLLKATPQLHRLRCSECALPYTHYLQTPTHHTSCVEESTSDPRRHSAVIVPATATERCTQHGDHLEHGRRTLHGWDGPITATGPAIAKLFPHVLNVVEDELEKIPAYTEYLELPRSPR